MTSLKAFSDLPKLDGRPENFDNWRFKMFQFLSKDPEYIKIVQWIEGSANITEDSITKFKTDNVITPEDADWYNNQLWSADVELCRRSTDTD